MEGLLVAIVFFAVAMLVPGALLFIGYRVSSVIGKVAAGLAASVVMVLELWLATSLAGIGSATSGSQAAYGIVKVSAFMFLCALLLYIVACIAKNEDDDTNHNSRGSQ